MGEYGALWESLGWFRRVCRWLGEMGGRTSQVEPVSPLEPRGVSGLEYLVVLPFRRDAQQELLPERARLAADGDDHPEGYHQHGGGGDEPAHSLGPARVQVVRRPVVGQLARHLDL